VFFGGIVAGSPETVADHVAAIDAAGLDGVLVMFPDWFDGIARFCDEVLASRPGLAAPAGTDWAAPIEPAVSAPA
jgi:alkanesulfonate monooxygenase SsuD/methylene tetrahydromethanopterin reductase-like flavin-dependent oxidoreductase (luciferase family)